MSEDNVQIEDVDAVIRDRQFDQAEELLERIIADPARRSLRASLKYAYVLQAQEKFGEAFDAFEIAESYALEVAEKVSILNRMSDLLYIAHDDDISRKIIEQMGSLLERSVALDSSERNAAALHKLCNIDYTLGRPKALESHALVLAKIPAGFVDAHLWLGAACFQLDRRARGLSFLCAVDYQVAQLSKAQLHRLAGLLVQ